MKTGTVKVIRGAALAAFALVARCGVAGFADGLDFSALYALDADVQEKCFDINVTCNGSKDGESIWKPLGVSINEDYKLVFDAQAGMTANIRRLEDYEHFGKYSDSASIDAFFSDAMFNDGRGRLRVEATELSDIYVQAEQWNVDLFETVNEQIEKNIEDYLASLDTNTEAGSKKFNDIVNAYKKFAESAEKNKESRLSTLKELINNKAAALKNAQSAIDIAKYAAQLKAAQAALKNYETVVNTVTILHKEFVTHLTEYARDMNTLGAYLGSTNAMEYFSHDWNTEDVLATENWKRWGKFSVPDKIDDSYGFGSAQIGGKRWHYIYDNLASTYMTWAWPLVEDDSGDPQPGFLKFMEHFNLTGLAPRYKGFVENINYDSEEHPQTNWVANGITAPKNWADGTTLSVTNGKYRVIASPVKIHTACPPQGAAYTSGVGDRIVFASADDSNVKVNVSTNGSGDVVVTIGVYYK